MAASHLTSGERVRIYEALFLLNRSFQSVVRRLYDLDNTRIFNPQRLRELRGLTKELQSEANHYFVENLNGIEARDWFRFGKVRIARDHRLNPERPAFGQLKQ